MYKKVLHITYPSNKQRYLGRIVCQRWNTTLIHRVDDDCGTYLQKCKRNNTNIISTVFRGTLYEYTAKKLLETQLKCYGVFRQGGSFDEGVDLIGHWDLSHFFDINKSNIIKQIKADSNPEVLALITNSTELNTLLANNMTSKDFISMQKDIKILVQCKNHKSKIQAKVIRELVGIYTHNINTPSLTSSTFMLLVSPGPLTKQAQAAIDQANIPFIHIIMTPLTLKPDIIREHVYKLDSWKGGLVESIYLNNYSKLLLKYLNIELEFTKLKQLILL